MAALQYGLKLRRIRKGVAAVCRSPIGQAAPGKRALERLLQRMDCGACAKMKRVSEVIEAGKQAYRDGLSYRNNPEPLPRYALMYVDTATGRARVDVDWSDIWLIGWKLEERYGKGDRNGTRTATETKQGSQ